MDKIKESLVFVVVVVLTVLFLHLVALFFEKKVFPQQIRYVSRTKKLSLTAMFAALSGVLMSFEVPLPFAPPFYQLDISELPILMLSLYLGPVAGVSGELLKVLVKLLIKGTSTAFVGDFANFLIGISMILPATLFYHWRKTLKRAIWSLALGGAVMTVFGSMLNAFYLVPKFAVMFGLPLEAIIAMGTAVNSSITSLNTLVLYAVVPFNLLKSFIVSFLTYFLYKRVEKILFKEKPMKSDAAVK